MKFDIKEILVLRNVIKWRLLNLAQVKSKKNKM